MLPPAKSKPTPGAAMASGPQRATAWSTDLARALWQRLAPVVPSVRFLDQHCPTDAFATHDRPSHRSWRVVGLSPLLRFMRYDPGGILRALRRANRTHSTRSLLASGRRSRHGRHDGWHRP
jgi:hypothetical protein